MTTLSIQLGAVDAVADELAGLAARLAGELPGCRAAAAQLRAALPGEAGDRAGAAAGEWAALAAVLAERCGSTARTLAAAVEAYRAQDAQLAAGLGAARPGSGPR
jgi:uncharacterized protein YukE